MMWPKERHQRILSLLSNNQLVSANDLAGLLEVSRETVRRDLLELEKKGFVNRVHGGAVLPNKEHEAPFENRRDKQIRAKQNIARKAVTLIPPGSSIMVDAGTTTSAFGQALAQLSGIMVITNSIDIAQTIKTSGSDIELVLLGGHMISDVPATYGELTLSEIARFNVDLAVIAPVAVHVDQGAFSFALQEAEIARTMIAQARENIILCDQTKLGTTSRVRIAQTNDINNIVTDNLVSADQVALFSHTNTQLIIAK
ncbi:DeoR/GlpR family DNA-binding transcription regulator [Gammaproteobacteria bacterium AS21]